MGRPKGVKNKRSKKMAKPEEKKEEKKGLKETANVVEIEKSSGEDSILKTHVKFSEN